MQSNSYKIVIIGESMAGKTSILLRYINDSFVEVSEKERTINANCFKKSVKMNNQTYTINIWDTAGEERYHVLTPMFYRDANGAVIVFDITRRDSFNMAEKWFKELREYTQNTQIILVGNKTDLNMNEVTEQEARALAKKHGAPFMSVSAKNGENIEALFQVLSQDIYHAQVKDEKKSIATRKQKMVIKEEVEHEDNQSSSCC